MRLKSENILLLMVTVAIVSCGPSQAELDAQATTKAADRSATQTAAVPTLTVTSEPTATSTLTMAPTFRPPGPWLITPQVEIQGDLRVESVVDEENWDVLLRISRGDDFFQEIDLNEMRFDNYPEEYFYPLGISGINAIILSDFESDDDPEIVLGLETPGAYCCTIVVVMYYDASSSQYRNTDAAVNKWTLSPHLVDIDQDGVDEIVRHNEELFYAMGGSGSGAQISPIQILSFSDGMLIDVSARFPEVIEEDAERIYDTCIRVNDCGGFIWAGYLAQMHVLGKAGEGWGIYTETCGDSGEFYEAQVALVEDVLREFGYLR